MIAERKIFNFRSLRVLYRKMRVRIAKKTEIRFTLANNGIGKGAQEKIAEIIIKRGYPVGWGVPRTLPINCHFIESPALTRPPGPGKRDER